MSTKSKRNLNPEAEAIISGPQLAETMGQASLLPRITKELFAEEQLASRFLELLKESTGADRASRQGVTTGRKEHPFRFDAVRLFQTSNIHHGVCIHTKVSATVGLGFVLNTTKGTTKDIAKAAALGTPPPAGATPGGRTIDPTGDALKQAKQSKVDEVLDPLCDYSFMDVLSDVCEDYHQTGNGYMEVVREGPGGPILGLHHIPAETVYIHIEADRYNRHFEVLSNEGTTDNTRMPLFGDSEDFLKRVSKNSILGVPAKADKISEVIHFRKPTSLSRWYGFPNWLSAVTSIELVQCLMQFKYDFFLNRGVPEFLLLFLGKKLDKKDWDKVVAAMQSHIGLAQSHKSLALNLTDENMKVQLEKLAMEGQGLDDGFDTTNETLSLNVVSAHRVPPLLAGIVLPGKIGATNELPNALMSFQLLVVGPDQRVFHQTFAKTLGNEKENGGLGLKPEDFVLKRITDEMNLGAMATIGGMKQTLPEAMAQGRDLNAGMKKED